MIQKAIFAFLILLQYGIVIPKESQCFFQLPDNKYVDLTPLIHLKPPDYEIMDQQYLYIFNFCEMSHAKCQGESALASQWNAKAGCQSIIGNKIQYEANWINQRNTSEGFKIKYTDGSFCGSVNSKREVNLILQCDMMKKADLVSASEPWMCSYEIKIATQYGCAYYYADDLDIVKQKSLQQGYLNYQFQPQDILKGYKPYYKSIYILLFAVFTFLAYLIVGSCTKMSYNKQGTFWDNIPNKQFWSEFPQYVVEGFMVTYNIFNWSYQFICKTINNVMREHTEYVV